MSASSHNRHSLLSELPSHVIASILQHACNQPGARCRTALLATSKPLRTAVLQQACKLTLHVDRACSPKALKEVQEVVFRRQPLQQLTLDIKHCTPEQVQIFLTHLAAAQPSNHNPQYPSAAQRCAVQALVIMGGEHSRPTGVWGSLLGSTFPSITSLSTVNLDPGMPLLQSLSACPHLTHLELHNPFLIPSWDLESLTAWIPHVRHVVLQPKSDLGYDSVTAVLETLGPQLSSLDWRWEEDPDFAALHTCTALHTLTMQLAMRKALADIVMQLPSLTHVTCQTWEADSAGKQCGWQELCILRPVSQASHVQGVPSGIHTLRLEGLELTMAPTPEDSMSDTRALAAAVTGAAQKLEWCKEGPSIRLHIADDLTADRACACFVAMLQGLTPLKHSLNSITIRRDLFSEGSMPALTEEVVKALDELASPTLQQLDMQCSSAEAGAWGALVNSLPHLLTVAVLVDELGVSSVQALGKLRREFGSRLRKVILAAVDEWEDEVGSELKELQAQLLVSKSTRVRLHLV